MEVLSCSTRAPRIRDVLEIRILFKKLIQCLCNIEWNISSGIKQCINISAVKHKDIPSM